MKKYIKSIKCNSFSNYYEFTYLFFLIIVTNFLNFNGINTVALYLYYLSIPLFATMQLARFKLPFSFIKILLLFFVYTFFTVLDIKNGVSHKTINVLGQNIAIFSSIIYFAFIDYKKINYRLIKIMEITLAVIIYIVVLLFSNVEVIEKGLGNYNGIGAVCLFMVLINYSFYLVNKRDYVHKKIFLLIAFAFIPAMLLTGTRTAILTLVMIFMVFYFFKNYRNKNKIMVMVLILTIALIIVGTYLFTNLEQFKFYGAINDFSITIFNKGIDTGRGWRWKAVFDSIEGNWLLGMGTGYSTFDTTTSHNSFLNILMQNGIIGISILLLLLIIIYKEIVKQAYGELGMFSAAAFNGILVYSCFETTLFQGNIAIALLQWLVIAIGVSKMNVESGCTNANYIFSDREQCTYNKMD